MMARALKGPLALVLAVMMIFSGGGMVAYAAEEDDPMVGPDGIRYNADDVAAVNEMIVKNKLNLTENDPAGWPADQGSWPYVKWEVIDNQYRITEFGARQFTGDLDISKLKQLKYFHGGSVYDNGKPFSAAATGITAVDMPNLTGLSCCHIKNLSSLTLSNLPKLIQLEFGYTGISEFPDLPGCPDVQTIYCDGTKITTLDLSSSGLTHLCAIDCAYGDLSVVNLDIPTNHSVFNALFNDSPIRSMRLPGNKSITITHNTGGTVIMSAAIFDMLNYPERVGHGAMLTVIPDEGYEYDGFTSTAGADMSSKYVEFSEPKPSRNGNPYDIDIGFYPGSREINIRFKGKLYPVTVSGGSVVGGATEVATGETVTVQADEAPEGKKFTRWKFMDSGDVELAPELAPELADATAPRTTFPMPARPVALTAQFDDLPPVEPDNPDNPDTPDTPEIPKTPEEIKQEAETTRDLDRLKDLEDTYKDLTGTTVNVLADNNTHGNFKNQVDKISVTGAAFNVDPGETVSLHFSKPQNNVTIDGTKYKTNSAVQLDISLRSGEKVLSRLAVPVTITVPVPSGVNPQNFWILHYNDAGEYEVITPTLNGDGTCSFTVDHFSVFAFVNAAGTPDPAEPAEEEKQDKKEKDDSNQRAVKAAMDAVKAANDGKTGKVQSYTTAAGATVPAVPVKLYGLDAALSVDTMETLAAGKTGLNVNLDNGAASVLIPAGFQMPTGTGVLGYGLGWQKDPLYANLMKAAVNGDGAKTEVYKLGGGTLPTTATVTLKTKLTGRVNVYYWNEETRRAALIASPTAADGKVIFATKQLGNFILTTGTI